MVSPQIISSPQTILAPDRTWSAETPGSEPWTARVSYDEERTSTIPRQNVTLRTESSDRWILVNTVYGVRVLGLESNSILVK